MSLGIEIIDEINLRVKLDDKAWALAKGQPIAFYIENRLVGGWVFVLNLD